MFAVQNNAIASKKRGREEDNDESSMEGFQEHRAKRTLALRQSPQLDRSGLYPASQFNNAPRSPNVATMTPAGSDSEEVPRTYCQKSHFSPWSSSPAISYVPSSQPSPSYRNPQSMLSPAMYSDVEDDIEMDLGEDQDDSNKEEASGRIATPINAQFSYGLSRQLPAQFSHSMTLHQPIPERGQSHTPKRRLPSPISEGESTPNKPHATFLPAQLGCPDRVSGQDIQMEVDDSPIEEKVTPKKGHSRMKHSLRNWTGFSPEAAPTKKFSMGYKSDCEKCKMGVPGHYSHIITFPNGYA